jgi:peroxiredoxin
MSTQKVVYLIKSPPRTPESRRALLYNPRHGIRPIVSPLSQEDSMKMIRAFSMLLLPACAFGLALADGAAGLKVGQPVPDFKLTAYDGTQHSLAQYRSSKGTVLIFVSTKCPVSNAYNDRMVALAAAYQPKGITFLGINANKAETPDDMAAHARDHKWNFPVLKDTGNKVADQLSASVTPEVFLVDSTGTLRYHGRIDDSQDEAAVKSHDLQEALDAFLAGKDLPRAEAKAFGCSIKRVG